ncbi:MAG: hypothetical protein E6K81_13415 [Candidatus Eisenbacteria bacterium]|uniref:ParB/Sulfiredoxin domain-containing protein n=1 Tax=Eiseniibacteriota bacterium TaxID=2212470 RepID=A0A538U2G4_UNCEI|nr:MAG: hypothetical protein E6K81_13415 [Candidatus Eisenbacteria bacterium]
MSTDDAPRLRMPDLRFVAVDALIPHEHHDELRSGPLVQRLREQGVLRNPPIVAALAHDDPRFVILDGANRVTAAQSAGLPHLLVQVVRYEDPGVRLSTWHHALIDVTVPALERLLATVPGLSAAACDLRHALAMLARREAIAFVSHGSGRALTLRGGDDLKGRNLVLNGVVACYRDQVRFHRVGNDSLVDAQADHPEVTALVVFPHFEPAEVLELATSGSRLPAGITRHLVAWRALRVNVPLDTLADPERTLAEKNRWLDEWLREKVHQRQVRFYQESTVLFDE